LKIKKKNFKICAEMTEEIVQTSVVTWLNYQYPNALYCASAGGVRTSMKQAVKMKRTGYVKGFPDLFIYESKKGYHGLAIELKTVKGTIQPSQKQWIKNLCDNGYYAKVCKGTAEAQSLIQWYMND
jgi:hypothetical protein